MLAVSILWIVIGAIYIVYRLMKDGDISRALSILLLPLILIIASFLLNSGVPKFALAVICLSSPIWVGVILFMLYRRNDGYSEKEALKILDLFHQHGYKDVLLEDMTLFFTDSPPRIVKSPYYDTKNKSIHDMWDWLCKEKTYELVNKDDSELNQIMGLDISNIPLNPKLSLKESYLQRKCKVVNYILLKRGLVYRKHFGGDLEYDLINSSIEYNHVFDNYIKNYNSEHH